MVAFQLALGVARERVEVFAFLVAHRGLDLAVFPVQDSAAVDDLAVVCESVGFQFFVVPGQDVRPFGLEVRCSAELSFVVDDEVSASVVVIRDQAHLSACVVVDQVPPGDRVTVEATQLVPDFLPVFSDVCVEPAFERAQVVVEFGGDVLTDRFDEVSADRFGFHHDHSELEIESRVQNFAIVF